MFKGCSVIGLMVLFGAAGFAASAPVEVLYVAELQGANISLLTYNINPKTAVAKQVGNPITVGGSSVDPIALADKHLIYVWSATDVWMYLTNSQGVPEKHPSQHLTFGFPHPVNTFLADPNGKFAYAGLLWTDPQGNNYADVVLFTIDQSTGELTNTKGVVGKYGPDAYTALTGFSFGSVGRRLYARYLDTGPHTCISGYDYYSVNQTTGQLGALTGIFYAQADCSGAWAVSVTDLLTGAASACCGSGSGALEVFRTPGGQALLYCSPTMLGSCGDEISQLDFDPANKNIFLTDADANQVWIGHMDFPTSQLLATSSSITGLPPIYFSPDSRLVYAVDSNDIRIYALQSSTGELVANTSLPDLGNVTIATATLHN